MLVAAKALGAFLALLATPKSGPLTILDGAYGNDSGVTASNVALARTQRAWDQMWLAHMGVTNGALPGNVQVVDHRPPVDFSKAFVVGIFGGSTHSVEGYEPVEAFQTGDEAVIRFRPLLTPSSGAAVISTQPYGFAIVSKTDLKLVIQLPDGRDGWKTVANFDAPTPPKVKKKGSGSF